MHISMLAHSFVVVVRLWAPAINSINMQCIFSFTTEMRESYTIILSLVAAVKNVTWQAFTVLVLQWTLFIKMNANILKTLVL